MDGSLAIEANRAALKRIVAMLIDMAGLGEPAPEDNNLAEVRASPLTASLRSAPLPLKGGEERGAVSPPRSPLPRRSGERWPAKLVGEGVDVTRDASCQKGAPERHGRALPRLLWRAIMALLRPAESAARRLIIAASRGLNVPPPQPRGTKPKPQTMEPLLRRFGLAVMVSRGGVSAVAGRAKADGGGAAESATPRIPTFPLFDPPRRLALYGQRARTVPPHLAPRFSFPALPSHRASRRRHHPTISSVPCDLPGASPHSPRPSTTCARPGQALCTLEGVSRRDQRARKAPRRDHRAKPKPRLRHPAPPLSAQARTTARRPPLPLRSRQDSSPKHPRNRRNPRPRPCPGAFRAGEPGYVLTRAVLPPATAAWCSDARASRPRCWPSISSGAWPGRPRPCAARSRACARFPSTSGLRPDA